jgi:hypothetical protein
MGPLKFLVVFGVTIGLGIVGVGVLLTHVDWMFGRRVTVHPLSTFLIFSIGGTIGVLLGWFINVWIFHHFYHLFLHYYPWI